MNPIVEKYTSRKFLLALVGVITGIVSIVQGEVVAGCSLMGTSIIGYLVAEGYIDAKSAQAIVDTVEVIADTIDGDPDEE